MSVSTFYILDGDGKFSHSRTGDITTLVDTVELLREEYVIAPPPETSPIYRWIDGKWVADEPEAEPIEVLQDSFR